MEGERVEGGYERVESERMKGGEWKGGVSESGGVEC